MITIIYIIIISYFVLGGVGFYFINRKRDPVLARESYTKFITYFVIIHTLFFSIVIDTIYFKYLSVLIVSVGFIEMFRLFYKLGYKYPVYYFVSNLIYALLSVGLFFFSELPKELILFSFLILSIFDSFSQITGQLWGKRKLFPTISPNKTLGGLVGGGLIALGSSLLLNSLYVAPFMKTITMALGIVLFAFIGDLAASYYKRKFQVKDYSNMIPGHGGILDRFDSLIAGGAWIALCIYVFNF